MIYGVVAACVAMWGFLLFILFENIKTGLSKSKCPLCNKRRHWDELKTVKRHNSYYGKTYRYHYSCLRDVLNNPERHGHRIVDLALDITDCLSSAVENAEKADGWRRGRIEEVKSRFPSLFWDKLG